MICIIDNGIENADDAQMFVDFISQFLDYVREKQINVEINDIAYEAECFVDYAGFLVLWEKMIDKL